jgi:hypothetical protein
LHPSPVVHFERNSLGRGGADRDGLAVYMFMLLQLAGKIWEVWQVLGPLYFKGRWHQQHTEEMDKEGKNALREFKAAMSKKTPLSLLRNKIAFHIDGWKRRPFYVFFTPQRFDTVASG